MNDHRLAGKMPLDLTNLTNTPDEELVIVRAAKLLLLRRLALLAGWFGARHEHGTLLGDRTEDASHCWGCQELRALHQELGATES